MLTAIEGALIEVLLYYFFFEFKSIYIYIYNLRIFLFGQKFLLYRFEIFEVVL
ncbi:hypothetical protein GLOIN_2v1574630 [Rhizophagus irregularis DAOM 181602=DAOM 197198]|uniref:Uncharacterized protein n=1 Tax=Rhizophagus irregularis (strain DAOM 181602 / DAOM 197198 / MUCL 43194) TaxID=747089 RepID=A0A2P4QA76_RHIID|nr:hypothetical protein GLOIN_2v1574630 [Rhizophagus irregularis DAOM 181602=DAOM 197198]POG74532.1 hypothetical protein GLOIN_2v1574630 [Rhizophagus irregularis DAOM 181602=DAOM 197198]|eukprot:XP_025181398.1 hypothetical protein GLOIN_2v1574630 [Rhizophagus irregularis DAOM 181602=DAOM 197198]